MRSCPVFSKIGFSRIRCGKNKRFIERVKYLPELITGFDAGLWAAPADSMTVYSKDWIVFRLTCGMEIES